MKDSKSILDLKETFLVSLFEDSSNGIALIDASGRIRMVNKKLCEVLNCQNQDLQNIFYSGLFSTAKSMSFESLKERLIKEPEKKLNLLQLYKRKSAADIFLPTEIKGYFDNEGRFDFVILTIKNALIVEEENNRSRFLNKNITEIIPDHIGIVNFDSKELVYSNFGTTYFGLSLEGVTDIGNFFSEIIHPDDFDLGITEFRQRLKKAKDNEIVDSIFRIADGDGNERWVHERAKVFSRNVDGSMASALFVHMDVTREKQAEKALIESESLYRELFQQNEMGIYRMDESMKFIHVNPAFCNMNGYSPEELKQMELYDLIPEALRRTYKTTIERATSGGVKSQQMEDHFITSEGLDFFGLSTIRILRNEKGLLTGFLGSVIDITELKSTQLALAESQAKFRDIVNNISEFTIISDRAGKLEFVSPPVTRILGFLPSDMIGRNFKSYFADEKAPNIFLNARGIWASLEKGNSKTWEIELRCFDNTKKWIEATTVWFIKATTGEIRFITVCRDISEKKKMNNAVAKVYQSVPVDSYLEFYDHFVGSIAKVLNVPYVYFGTPDFENNVVVCKTAFREGAFVRNFTYPLTDSRCERVLKEKKTVIVQNDLGEAFPSDREVREEGIKSYLGIPLMDSAQNVIGLLSILDIKPFEDPDFAHNVLQIFATRLAGELQRDEARRILLERELEFRGLFENNPIPVAVARVNGSILRVNGAFCKMVGYDERELTDKLFSDFTHPDDIDIGPDVLEENLKSRFWGLYNYQKRYFHKNGNIIWVDVSATIVRGQNDEVKHIIGVIRDITESKKAEEERLRIYHEQQEILDSIPALFFYKDEKNNIIRCNKKAAASLNLTVEEMEGKNTTDLYPPDQAEEYLKDDLEVINSGKPKLGIVEPYQTPQGVRWVQTDKTPYFDTEGVASGVLVYAVDVTDLKRVQQELEEKNEKLRQYIDSNMLLENFAYIASHDLKEPVRTVCNFAQLLEKKYSKSLDERALEYLDFIVDGSKDMNKLIDDLLTYSRVRTENQPAKDVDLDKLLFLMQRNLAKSIREHNVTIEFENIPRFVKGNKTKLGQLFQNLVSNSIKFRKKGVPPVIRILAIDKKDKWLFSVSDNGIGIEKKFFDRIFLLFKRLHTKQQYEGTGIGLALAKKIVDQHGGDIWLESALGEGTTFYFTLPKNQVSEI